MNEQERMTKVRQKAKATRIALMRAAAHDIHAQADILQVQVSIEEEAERQKAAREAEKKDLRRRILRLMQNTEGALQPREIAEMLGANTSDVRAELWAMKFAGEVQRHDLTIPAYELPQKPVPQSDEGQSDEGQSA